MGRRMASTSKVRFPLRRALYRSLLHHRMGCRVLRTALLQARQVKAEVTAPVGHGGIAAVFSGHIL